MENKKMEKEGIKVALKYIFALSIPPLLCAFIMIPLFTALLFATGLLDICPARFVPFVCDAVDAIAVGISGFIMSLLISFVARKREVMTTLFGVLIVIVVYAVAYVDMFNCFSTSDKIPEDFSMYQLRSAAVNAIFLLGFAMSGALAIRRKRRLRAQKQ